jgi:hypothetical protein
MGFLVAVSMKLDTWKRLPISRPCMSTMQTSTVSISPLERGDFQLIESQHFQPWDHGGERLSSFGSVRQTGRPWRKPPAMSLRKGISCSGRAPAFDDRVVLLEDLDDLTFLGLAFGGDLVPELWRRLRPAAHSARPGWWQLQLVAVARSAPRRPSTTGGGSSGSCSMQDHESCLRWSGSSFQRSCWRRTSRSRRRRCCWSGSSRSRRPSRPCSPR